MILYRGLCDSIWYTPWRLGSMAVVMPAVGIPQPPAPTLAAPVGKLYSPWTSMEGVIICKFEEIRGIYPAKWLDT